MKPERLRKAAADAVLDACNRVGREAVQALLAKYGALKVSGLVDHQLEAFIDAADELQPPPRSDDYLIGLALGSLHTRGLYTRHSAEECGKALRDKLGEVGITIVRVEKPAPAQDPPPVPLSAVAFGTVIRLMGGVGCEYLVGVNHMSSSFNRVLIKLDNGNIQHIYQDVLVQFVRSHV
jgi:hypothetical protein